MDGWTIEVDITHHGINGKILKMLKKITEFTKSAVMLHREPSDIFKSRKIIRYLTDSLRVVGQGVKIRERISSIWIIICG